jgi:hypothetical protein
METMQEYLDLDGGIIFNICLYNRFSSIGDSCYSDICGGFIEGVYQWADHNIYSVDESENQKYIGWTINFNGAIRRVYIEKWVMAIAPKNFRHARALFSKYLRSDEKFNTSPEANQDTIYKYH